MRNKAPKSPSSFARAMRFLSGFTDYEKQARHAYDRSTYDLDRFRRFCSALGDPQKAFPCIHVTGTKGKGSLSIMLHSILSKAGYKTGLYTSPHLIRINERIVVRHPIPDIAFVGILNHLRPLILEFRRKGDHLTFFEIITAMAFVCFKEQKVDAAVIEVGMGGRLDTTNIIKPIACAITSVGLDHTDKLGKTIPAIAREKAGIIKRKIPFVSAVGDASALKVIKKKASFEGAHGLYVGKDFTHSEPCIETCSYHLTQTFSVETPFNNYDEVRISAIGVHQARNASCALAIIGLISESLPVTKKEALAGLASAELPARAQVIRHSPTVILDAAHNEVSMKALKETLDKTFPGKKVTLVMGLMADKDIRTILRTILPVADKAVFTRSKSPRAERPEALAKIARTLSHDIGVSVARNAREAMRKALAITAKDGMVVITGSFYLAGEMIDELLAFSGKLSAKRKR